MSSNNFKVIIVGGGPVGITAARALVAANIDFVLLERRPEVVIDAGSNLVMLPIGMRVLGQLGLLDDLFPVSSPLAKFTRMDHQGRDIGDFDVFGGFAKNHGTYPRVISRHDLTRVLFESMPAEAQAKMHANKKVSNIQTTAESVIVSCADGTSYKGSMILGADGAHSLVRQRMRTLAIEAAAPAEQINEEQPYLTTYRAIWIRFPTQNGLKPGDAIETHGPNATVQLFSGDDSSVIGVYERMAEGPTRERVRYSQADEEAFIGRWGHLPISAKMTIADAYATRISAGLTSLEEGVVRNWSWGGRIVLAGDAAHKFTPSTGQGCNNGIVDVVALANQLHAAVSSSSTPPSSEQLAVAFGRYQAERQEAVIASCQAAGNATAAATWQTGVHKFIDRYVIGSSLMQRYFVAQAAKGIAMTPVLDFVRGEEKLVGRVPWVQPIKPVLAA